MAPRFNWELIGGLVALAGSILLAILVLELVKRWVRKAEPDSLDDEIERFRNLRDEGLLTPEEFARVESTVENRSRPAPAAPAPKEEGIFDASTRDKLRVPPPHSPAPADNDGNFLPS